MICHNCGKEFEGHKRKFCETKCKTRYNNRKAKGYDLSVYEPEPPTYNKPVYINCERCGNEFHRKKNGGKSGNEYTRYCSVSCGVKSYYNSGEVAKSRIEKNRLLFISKEIAGIKKLKKNIDNRNKRIISEAYTYAKHNHCRTCGAGITQDSVQCRKRYCDNCKRMAIKESKRRGRKAHREKDGRVRTHKKRAEKYGVPYEEVNRIKVFNRYNWKCASCNKDTPKDIMKTYDNPDAPTLDHIIPISKGGPHMYSNIQLLCRQCNTAKSDVIGMLC